MNLPSPLKTNRVKEPIASLVRNVVFTSEITDPIKPPGTVNTTVTTAPAAPFPKLTSVEITGATCTVKGKNLENVNVFTLVPVNDPKCGLVATSITKNTTPPVKSFSATLPSAPPEGDYHAWVVDLQGQRDFQSVAIKKAIPPSPPSPPSTGKVSCEIAAVVPSEAVVIVPGKASTPIPRKVFVEVTSKGDSFPPDVLFEANHPHLRCESSIPTADPRVRLLPITICSAPGKGNNFRAEIKAKTVSTVAQEGAFEFNVLQP